MSVPRNYRTMMAAVLVASACGGSPVSTKENPSSSVQPGAAQGVQSAATAATVANVRVVNMIPESLSLEVNQDSEPFLAVHQTQADWMAASAFTRDPAGPGSSTAPIFVSQDSGKTWTLNSIVPSESWTQDITHA